METGPTMTAERVVSPNGVHRVESGTLVGNSEIQIMS